MIIDADDDTDYADDDDDEAGTKDENIKTAIRANYDDA